MSFRSLSGLPSCLRGKPAWQCASRCTLRKAISWEPVVSHRTLVYCIRPAPDAVATYSTDARWSTGNHFGKLSTDFFPDANENTNEIPNDTYSDSSKFETFLPRPIDRVEEDLDVFEVAENPTIRHDVKSKGYGLDEWITIHDKFLCVRRQTPDQMATIFKEEMFFASHFIGTFAHEEASLRAFRRKWDSLGAEEQDRVLPKVLIGSLAKSASQTLFVLTGIATNRHTFRVRMNCLREISIMYWRDLEQDSTLKSIYEAQIDIVRSPDVWPTFKLPAVLLQNLLYWSSPEQCQVIIRNFSQLFPDADHTSIIAIIDHYLRRDDPENAFDYFKSLPGDLLEQPSGVVRDLRDRLLKLDVVVKSEDGANFKYLPQILALGTPSDEALHNIVIENAITNGLPDVAWDVYQYLEQSQFKTSARSHLVLLRDAFARGALPKVNAIMTAIHQRGDLTNDPYLVSYSMNIVRVIRCYDRKINAKEALAHIMALYDRAYDRRPLVKLHITPEKANNNGLPQPNAISLAFTIWTYILVQSNEREVLRLWQWIKYLISIGDTAIIEAARYDIIYNAFMLFHARKESNLSRSLEVMQHMLWNDLCVPTLRSWSVLICSFLRRGQVEEARRILVMMQRKGLRVEDIVDKYSKYIPAGSDLDKFAEIAPEALDETQMPDAVELLLSSPASHAAVGLGQ